MSPPLKATSKTDEKGNERPGMAAQALHADDHLNVTTDISPPLHVSTNFRYVSNPADLITARDVDVSLLLPSLKSQNDQKFEANPFSNSLEDVSRTHLFAWHST